MMTMSARLTQIRRPAALLLAALSCVVSVCAALPAAAQQSAPAARTDPAQSLAAQQSASMPAFPEEMTAQLGAVGRVNIAGFKIKGNCTGTLVAPAVVLTAAHCTGNPDVMTNSRVFVAGWDRGEFIAARKIKRVVRHPGYQTGSHINIQFDIGLLFLEEPITEVAPLPISLDRAEQVTIAGYHRFVPHMLSGREDCPVLSRNARLLRLNCPVVSGNSGGPVLEHNDAGDWVVTAVVSSQERRADGIRAIAVRMPHWVHEMLAEQ
ncbi:trypsin-like serine peptidase [Aliishimia ponticola]|nr:trypsin-like serine protease [Aliishimia ponticola]